MKTLLLKNCEKVLKKYFRYLFRYPESKFPGTVGSSQVHSIAKKSHKMLSRTPKNPKCFAHVEVERNTNNVVESSIKQEKVEIEKY